LVVVEPARGGIMNPTDVEDDVGRVQDFWISAADELNTRHRKRQNGCGETVISMKNPVVGRSYH
jgi:hypothetical protein